MQGLTRRRLGQFLRGAWGRCSETVDLYTNQTGVSGSRSMVNFYEIFSKERRAEGRRRLQEELKKGHFDDFKQLRDTNGKLFRGSVGLLPQKISDVFPLPSVVSGSFQRGKRAVLLCAAARDGAQPMIDAWTRAFDDHFRDQDPRMVGIIELSVVDSVVMSLPVVRSLLCNEKQQAEFEEKYQHVDAKSLFLFKGSTGFQDVLDMFQNRLIGYVYLLDQEGRIRWKGCGFPEEEELNHLIQAASGLAEEKGRG
jgi:ATPase complex subunit ATP10